MSITPLAKSERIRRALLLATGQNTSFGSGAGFDDGALQKGVAKSYTILTTGQYSGTTNITINSKTDVHSNECVIDNNTGLMWSRTASASVGPTSNGELPWTTTGAGATAEGIFPYCAAANVASLAGYSDWYIPNDTQLQSLENKQTCTFDAVAFPTTEAAFKWSSTTLLGANTVCVLGTGYAYLAQTFPLKVWLVRGPL